jgi:hypothetical protein
MLQIEDDPQLDGTRSKELSIDGRDQEEVTYVLTLLVNSGFATGNKGADSVLISGLTWDGHELLNNIRDTEIWKKTKARVAGLASVSLSILVEIAKEEIKKHIRLP